MSRDQINITSDRHRLQLLSDHDYDGPYSKHTVAIQHMHHVVIFYVQGVLHSLKMSNS